jgi:hypothetical protein
LRWLRKNGRTLRPEPWRQKNWLLHHDNAPSHTSFFTRECFTPQKIWLSSPTHRLIMAPCDFYVAPIEGKTERLSVWLSWSDRGKTAGGDEHPHRTQLQDGLKNGRSAGNGAYAWKETNSRVLVTTESKVSFLPDGSTSSGIW